MASLFERLFGRRPPGHADVAFYAAVVAQARDPVFYAELGVPDTLDGRFDMVALHVFLVMHRLKGQGPAADERSRHLYETMIDDLDRSLREMGAGDMGVPKRVKTMVRGMHGRILAYTRALDDADPRHLEVVLDNNVYGTVREVDPARLAALAAYVRTSVAALAAQPLDALLTGEPRFAAASPP